jgi:hypothetical protein
VTRTIARRLKQLENRAKEVAAVHPVHRLIFADDPEPADLPPGSTVHRIVFVDPAANSPLNAIAQRSGT